MSAAPADAMAAAIKYLDSADLGAIWAALEDPTVKDALAAAPSVEMLLEAIGAIVPPVAVVANDVKIGVDVAEGLYSLYGILSPIIAVLNARSGPAPNQYDLPFTTAEKR